jgi:MscS family membrane protein
VLVTFSALSASSLDVLVVYTTMGPEPLPWLMLRERLNLAIMRLVAAQGLSFAFPTQTLQLTGPAVDQHCAPSQGGKS